MIHTAQKESNTKELEHHTVGDSYPTRQVGNH